MRRPLLVLLFLIFALFLLVGNRPAKNTIQPEEHVMKPFVKPVIEIKNFFRRAIGDLDGDGADELVLVTTKRIYFYDEGNVVWERPIPPFILGSLSVVEGRILLGAGSKLFAIGLDGNTLWSKPVGSTFVVIGDRIYVLYDGKLSVLSPDGEVLKTVKVGPFRHIVAADGNVVLFSYHALYLPCGSKRTPYLLRLYVGPWKEGHLFLAGLPTDVFRTVLLYADCNSIRVFFDRCNVESALVSENQVAVICRGIEEKNVWLLDGGEQVLREQDDVQVVFANIYGNGPLPLLYSSSRGIYVPGGEVLATLKGERLVVAGDVDGDGKEEVALLGEGRLWFVGEGEVVEVPVGKGILRYFGRADFSGDGCSELLVQDAYGGLYVVGIYGQEGR